MFLELESADDGDAIRCESFSKPALALRFRLGWLGRPCIWWLLGKDAGTTQHIDRNVESPAARSRLRFQSAPPKRLEAMKPLARSKAWSLGTFILPFQHRVRATGYWQLIAQ